MIIFRPVCCLWLLLLLQPFDLSAYATQQKFIGPESRLSGERLASKNGISSKLEYNETAASDGAFLDADDAADYFLGKTVHSYSPISPHNNASVQSFSKHSMLSLGGGRRVLPLASRFLSPRIRPIMQPNIRPQPGGMHPRNFGPLDYRQPNQRQPLQAKFLPTRPGNMHPLPSGPRAGIMGLLRPLTSSDSANGTPFYNSLIRDSAPHQQPRRAVQTMMHLAHPVAQGSDQAGSYSTDGKNLANPAHVKLSKIVKSISDSMRTGKALPSTHDRDSMPQDIINVASIMNGAKNTFEFKKKLGKGAFGDVYLVKSGSGKQYAVKSYQAESEDAALSIVKDIRGEMQIGNSSGSSGFKSQAFAEKTHLLVPNDVVKEAKFPLVYQMGPNTFKLNRFVTYSVMAMDVRKLVSSLRFPENACAALDVSKQIIQTVANLHTLRLVHYDLKPENLLINIDGNVYLGDLAGAQIIDTKATSYTITFLYAAPEVARAFSKSEPIVVSVRHDAWALGATLSDVWCSSEYFEGEPGNSLNALIEKNAKMTQNDILVNPECNPRMPKSMLNLMRKFLQVDPSKRMSVIESLSDPAFTETDC